MTLGDFFIRGVNNMECKQIQKLIELFDEDKLSYKDEQCFVNHMMSCEDCQEELEIYYIIRYGLSEEKDVTYSSKEYKQLIESYEFKELVDLKLHNSIIKINKIKEYMLFLNGMFMTANFCVIMAIIIMIITM